MPNGKKTNIFLKNSFYKTVQNDNSSLIKLTLKSFVQHLENNEFRIGSIKQYKLEAERLYKYFAVNNLTEIKKKDLINYKNLLVKRFKTSSVNTKIVALNKFLKFIKRKDLVLDEIRVQRRTNLENALCKNEYERLVKWAKRLNKKKITYIIKTLAMTGIRIGELKYITTEAVKDGFATVYNKNKARTIIISKKLTKELKNYIKDQKIETGTIFKTRTDKPISNQFLWLEMQNIAGQAKIKKSKVYAHSFRHLFAKNFMTRSDDITLLADLLGHSNLETTRIYTKRSIKEQRELLDQI